ncbi:MAG: hypothetical protein MR425_08105 [Lachnospiraceae bacterium]|nr:hypothetical protein [Lachnospiraceae bacterium]
MYHRKAKEKINYKTMICLVMAFLIFITPFSQMNVQAASVTSIGFEENWLYPWVYYQGKSVKAFRIEEKQEANLGYFYTGVTTNNFYESKPLIKFPSIKFKSSNPKVATISKKGMLTTKKPGEVLITISGGTAKEYCYIKVEKKGVLKMNASKFKKVHKYAKQLYSYQKKKINIDNCYKLSDLYLKLDKAVNTTEGLNRMGFYSNANVSTTMAGSTVFATMDLVEPKLMTVNGNNVLDKFVKDNDPRNNIEKYFCMTRRMHDKKILARDISSKCAVTLLKQKVTEEQIFAIKKAEDPYLHVTRGKKATFKVYIIDGNTGYRYAADAKVELGDKEMDVYPEYLKLKKSRREYWNYFIELK